MRLIRRALAEELTRAVHAFPAVLLTGPRRAGKTTLLQAMFPAADYHLLEDPDWVARFRADPRRFIEEVRTPVILDEIQNVPELLNYIRAAIDRKPRARGQWLLTGSQEAPLMRGVTESMAGRVAVMQLLPLSLAESGKVTLLRGGFPEVLARPAAGNLWFRSYLQTYLERDVRAVSGIRDLSVFRRFLALVASRCGQILNKTDLAAPLGVSVPTITQWLNVLEITGQIIVVPPYFENFGKRLLKSPKHYFVDSGLACHLLGIEWAADLERSPFLGALFEGFVAAEICKRQSAAGRARALYFFRDQQGLEVDFVVPVGNARLRLIEVKASRTVSPADAEAVSRLARAVPGLRASAYVLHRRGRQPSATGAVSPGVSAVTLDDLDDVLGLVGGAGTRAPAAVRKRTGP